MTDPNNPLGGSTPDDFDALLDALGGDAVASPGPTAPPPPPPPPPLPSPPARPPAPPAANATSRALPLPVPMPPLPAAGTMDLFDDADSDTPTRMVDAAQIKRDAGISETPARSVRSGLDAVFTPRAQSTAPPPPMPADGDDDIPEILSSPAPDLDAEISLASEPPRLPVDSIQAPAIPAPPARPAVAIPAPPRPMAQPFLARPSSSPVTAVAEPRVPLPLPTPRESPELASLVLDDEPLEMEPEAPEEPPSLPPSDNAAPPEEDTSFTQGAADDDDEVSLTMDEATRASLVSITERGPGEGDVPASTPTEDAPSGVGASASPDDEGPVFETEEGDDEEISFEVGDDDDATVSDADRGALLAATVTSRKRHDDTGVDPYALDPKAEVESRASMLEHEADYVDEPARAAEMLVIAGELVEGVLGDRGRAKALYEKAQQFGPEAPFVLRALRRIALADGDVTRALELSARERELPLSVDEREALDAMTAEIAAREGAAAAEETWGRIGEVGGVRGALARLFQAGSHHDQSAMGAALGELGQHTTGMLAAAASLARARLAEGAAEGDTALAAVQSAVQRDPSDVTSWLAMARIAIGRENAQTFRDALSGIARTAQDSAAGWASVALERVTNAVLSDTVVPATVPTAGVAAWLMVHALRDGGLDEGPQVVAALAAANDTQRTAWLPLSPDGEQGGVTEVGRYLALRRAAAGSEPGVLASAAAELLQYEEAGRSSVESALLAAKGAMSPDELRPLDLGDALRRPELAAALIGTISGLDAVDTRLPAFGEGAFDRLSGAERTRRADPSSDEARKVLADVGEGDGPTGARVFALRESGRLGDDLGATVLASRSEATLAKDPRRVAALQFLAALASAGLALEGAADEALDAARAMEGDLAAAELAAVFGLRGEIPPAYTSEVLLAAAGDGSTVATRVAAVRSALRLAATEPEQAADALFLVWRKFPADGALAALVLRALPHDDVEHRAEVLKDLAERAASVSGPAALAAWTLLAHTYSENGRPGDAAQALGKARSFAPQDPALLAWEEKLWLDAGMFAEVAERSFESLKIATTDEARIAAYERLAELDSTFRNDVASAVLTYQAILELAPGHMASLRTLERYFLEQGRHDELLRVYDKLIRHVNDPEDATAISHAAARIAIKQAEGDHGAGSPFWWAAFERNAADMRVAMALSAEARRTGDLARFAEVSLRAEELAVDPAERATFGTRAGEALLLLNEPARAVEALDRAVGHVPTHPVALTELSSARKAAGDVRGAAEALEQLARSTRVPAQSLEVWLQAATLWQDEVNDVDRARAALQEVLSLEPAHPEAFARSLRALGAQGDKQAELDVLQKRVGAGGEAEQLLPLHQRIAELAEDLGDPNLARTHLRAVLAIEPDRVESLRALARLARTAADWPQAADAMIKLARLTQDQVERVELMYVLGEIFDQHLSDPKRAEAAYKRVLQFNANDIRTLGRLADLYGRTDEGNAEAETLRTLTQATPPGASRRALQIRLAAVLSEKLGDGKKAEEVLEGARREAPTDMDVLRAFARLYVRQESPMALAVLLDRAAAEVRRQLDADLTSPTYLELLTDILKLRGRVDGARVVGAVASGLGVETDKLTPLSRDGVIPGAGASALTLEVLEMLAPPTVTTAHRELMRLSSDVLEKLLPFEPGAVRAEKLGARPHPLRAEIDRWSAVFDLGPVEIYLGPTTPLVVTPIGRHPAAVLLPVDLRDTPTARFAVARAMVIVALSLPLIVRLPGRDVTVMLAAMLRQFDPMFAIEGVDLARLDDLARRITRAFRDVPRHAELAPHGFEVIATRAIDGDAMAAGVIELANRVALLASGDVKGAMESLSPAGSTPREALAGTPVLGRLVRVAISDRFLEARHLTGADKRTSSG